MSEYEIYLQNWNRQFGPSPENPNKSDAGRPCTEDEFNRSRDFFSGKITLEELERIVSDERDSRKKHMV